MNNKIYNYIPLTTLATSVVTAIILNHFFPIRVALVPFPYNLLGLLFVGFGLYLGFQSVRLLKSRNTTMEPGESPSLLIIECPYSYTRNPIYFGFLLVTIGTAIALSSLSSFIASAIFYLVVNAIVIPFEEKRLYENFGADYEKYKKSVRRWI